MAIYLEHEDEAVSIVMHYAKDKDIAHEMYGLQTSLPLINTGDVAIGYMDEDGWLSVKKYLLLQNQDIGSVNISDCYTTQFVKSKDI